MSTGEVDLDALAAGYRYRAPSAEMLQRARAVAAEADLRPGDWALDLGGGYGRHAATWTALEVRPLVVDPSGAMRRRAARRDGVVVVGARAEQLPFRDDTFGLVYAHLSVHYFRWRAALREALRVLRGRGSLAIATLGPRHHPRSFLARWFPSIVAADEARFPDPGELVSHLEALGAVAVRIEAVDATTTRAAGEWRDAVIAGFVSSLQLLSAAELAAGLAAFDTAHPDPDEPIEYVIRYDWVRAAKRHLC